MALKWLVCLATLAAFPVDAQQVVTRFSGSQAFLTPLPTPRFDLRADPSSPLAGISSGTAARSVNQNFEIVHRYFYDDNAHTYFGYDVVIQPGPQAGDYRVTFYDLSIGPLDFATGLTDAPDPAQWRKLPLPSMPAPQVMQDGDVARITVSTDAASGQSTADLMRLQRPIGMTAAAMIVRQTMTSRGGGGPMASPDPPTVSGEAREFSVDDAEMHMQRARVIVNGQNEDFGVAPRPVSGSLIWLFVPNHGRYVLSLSPRADLGFVKAGEVRGGIVTFTVGKDQVRLESPIAIAPGDAPYILYVLHDPEWTPTSDRQGAQPLMGSVSARELAALKR